MGHTPTPSPPVVDLGLVAPIVLYQSTYTTTCTIYGRILVLAWREPVYDDLDEGDYTLGTGGEVPVYDSEAPDYAPERRVR